MRTQLIAEYGPGSAAAAEDVPTVGHEADAVLRRAAKSLTAPWATRLGEAGVSAEVEDPYAILDGREEYGRAKSEDSRRKSEEKRPPMRFADEAPGAEGRRSRATLLAGASTSEAEAAGDVLLVPRTGSDEGLPAPAGRVTTTPVPRRRAAAGAGDSPPLPLQPQPATSASPKSSPKDKSPSPSPKSSTSARSPPTKGRDVGRGVPLAVQKKIMAEIAKNKDPLVFKKRDYGRQETYSSKSLIKAVKKMNRVLSAEETAKELAKNMLAQKQAVASNLMGAAQPEAGVTDSAGKLVKSRKFGKRSTLKIN